jgi:uncharacterized protein YodC (DUF2158 family)
MAAKNFKVGDIVRLKSGGPDMSISSVTAGMTQNMVHCVWFAGKKNEGAIFHPDVLEPAQSKEKASA